MRNRPFFFVLVVLLSLSPPTPVHAQSPPDDELSTADHRAITAGKRLYRRRCVFCHGTNGQGDGQVARYVFPKPRDLALGVFKIRSTPTGELPTDQDLFDTLTRGLPGTTMPSWANLSEGERWSLVAYVKTLFDGFGKEEGSGAIEIGAPKPPYPESVMNGRRLYLDLECWKCHGLLGKGDGPSAAALVDYWNFPIAPADLTVSRNWRGGNRPEDVFRSIAVGIGGTPMPSWLDALREDQIWDLTNYLLTIILK